LEQPSVFFRRHDADARIESAIAAIRALLPVPLLPAHKRELLSICIWKVTEADGGKYGTRYRSDVVFAKSSPDWLAHAFPNSRGVRLVDHAKLSFPEEQPDLVAAEAGRLWHA
jgi:hypothetical protein